MRRCTEHSVIFDAQDQELPFNSKLAHPIRDGDRRGPVQTLLNKLMLSQRLHSYADRLSAVGGGAVVSRLMEVRFSRATHFFHIIKIVLHEEAFRDPAMASDVNLRLFDSCMGAIEAMDDADELSAYTESTAHALNFVTRNWSWNRDEWREVAPIIIGAFIAAAGRFRGNAHLRPLLEGHRQF